MGTITRLDEKSLKAYRPSPCTFKMWLVRVSFEHSGKICLLTIYDVST